MILNQVNGPLTQKSILSACDQAVVINAVAQGTPGGPLLQEAGLRVSVERNASRLLLFRCPFLLSGFRCFFIAGRTASE